MIVPNWRNSKNPNSVKQTNQRRYVITIIIIYIITHDLFNSRKHNDTIYINVSNVLSFYISFDCACSFFAPSIEVSRKSNKIINLISTLSPFDVALVGPLITHANWILFVYGFFVYFLSIFTLSEFSPIKNFVQKHHSACMSRRSLSFIYTNTYAAW